MGRRGTRRGAVLALVGAITLWSGSLSIVRLAVDAVQPATLTFWRCAVGAALLVSWTLVRGVRSSTPVPRGGERSGGGGGWWAQAVACGASCGAAFVLIAIGMGEVGSGPAGIVLSSIPGLTVLLAAFGPPVGGSRLGGVHALGSLGLGVLAALTLALPGGGGAWSVGGLVALAGAALAQAISNVTSARCLERRDPLVVAAVSMTVAALVVAPFSSFSGTMPSGTVVLAIVALGLLPTGLAYVLFFHGVEKLGPARAAFSNFLVPPIAIGAGMLVLGELPDPSTLGALVLATMALALGLRGDAPAAGTGWRGRRRSRAA